MTPSELRAAAIKIFGERGYSAALAKALGVDYSQVWRYLSGRTLAPGPVIAAVKCWLEKSDERNDPENRRSDCERNLFS